MILIEFGNIIEADFASKYKDKVNVLDFQQYQDSSDWPISFIEAIKKSEVDFDITIVSYMQEIVLCLDALKIDYTLVYLQISDKNIPETLLDDYIFIKMHECKRIIMYIGEHLEDKLRSEFEWIKEADEEEKQELVVQKEFTKPELPQNKNNLTMEQLIGDDVEITEADVRELKATQNKLKVGMLLQAKNSLNRVLKLSNTLDKLYDKLLERIDNGLDTTDTASLMYTTEYIAKALSDTNQFIVSLISNEKIQNFFIIDNTNIVNVSSNDRVDINSREKIRKAAEIVLENIDYFAKGDFQNLKNPNVIDISEEDINANSES